MYQQMFQSFVSLFLFVSKTWHNVDFLALSRDGYNNEVKLFDGNTNANDASLEMVCYCRSNHDPIFFLAPNPETPGDTISAFCAINDSSSYSSFGIFDEVELFDTLLFKRINTVSESVMDPLPKNLDGNVTDNGIVCNDYYGYPTVSLYIPFLEESASTFFRSHIKVSERVSWLSSFRKQLDTFMPVH